MRNLTGGGVCDNNRVNFSSLLFPFPFLFSPTLFILYVNSIHYRTINDKHTHTWLDAPAPKPQRPLAPVFYSFRVSFGLFPRRALFSKFVKVSDGWGHGTPDQIPFSRPACPGIGCGCGASGTGTGTVMGRTFGWCVECRGCLSLGGGEKWPLERDSAHPALTLAWG